MLINKRKNRILGDKKLLHKVGKRWVTISIAMLGLLGAGSAVETTTHASSVNASNDQNTNVGTVSQKGNSIQQTNLNHSSSLNSTPQGRQLAGSSAGVSAQNSASGKAINNNGGQGAGSVGAQTGQNNGGRKLTLTRQPQANGNRNNNILETARRLHASLLTHANGQQPANLGTESRRPRVLLGDSSGNTNSQSSSDNSESDPIYAPIYASGGSDEESRSDVLNDVKHRTTTKDSEGNIMNGSDWGTSSDMQSVLYPNGTFIMSNGAKRGGFFDPSNQNISHHNDQVVDEYLKNVHANGDMNQQFSDQENMQFFHAINCTFASDTAGTYSGLFADDSNLQLIQFSNTTGVDPQNVEYHNSDTSGKARTDPQYHNYWELVDPHSWRDTATGDMNPADITNGDVWINMANPPTKYTFNVPVQIEQCDSNGNPTGQIINSTQTMPIDGYTGDTSYIDLSKVQEPYSQNLDSGVVPVAIQNGYYTDNGVDDHWANGQNKAHNPTLLVKMKADNILTHATIHYTINDGNGGTKDVGSSKNIPIEGLPDTQVNISNEINIPVGYDAQSGNNNIFAIVPSNSNTVANVNVPVVPKQVPGGGGTNQATATSLNSVSASASKSASSAASAAESSATSSVGSLSISASNAVNSASAKAAGSVASLSTSASNAVNSASAKAAGSVASLSTSASNAINSASANAANSVASVSTSASNAAKSAQSTAINQANNSASSMVASASANASGSVASLSTSASLAVKNTQANEMSQANASASSMVASASAKASGSVASLSVSASSAAISAQSVAISQAYNSASSMTASASLNASNSIASLSGSDSIAVSTASANASNSIASLSTSASNAVNTASANASSSVASLSTSAANAVSTASANASNSVASLSTSASSAAKSAQSTAISEANSSASSALTSAQTSTEEVSAAQSTADSYARSVNSSLASSALKSAQTSTEEASTAQSTADSYARSINSSRASSALNSAQTSTEEASKAQSTADSYARSLNSSEASSALSSANQSIEDASLAQSIVDSQDRSYDYSLATSANQSLSASDKSALSSAISDEKQRSTAQSKADSYARSVNSSRASSAVSSAVSSANSYDNSLEASLAHSAYVSSVAASASRSEISANASTSVSIARSLASSAVSSTVSSANSYDRSENASLAHSAFVSSVAASTSRSEISANASASASKVHSLASSAVSSAVSSANSYDNSLKASLARSAYSSSVAASLARSSVESTAESYASSGTQSLSISNNNQFFSQETRFTGDVDSLNGSLGHLTNNTWSNTFSLANSMNSLSGHTASQFTSADRQMYDDSLANYNYASSNAQSLSTGTSELANHAASAATSLNGKLDQNTAQLKQDLRSNTASVVSNVAADTSSLKGNILKLSSTDYSELSAATHDLSGLILQTQQYAVHQTVSLTARQQRDEAQYSVDLSNILRSLKSLDATKADKQDVDQRFNSLAARLLDDENKLGDKADKSSVDTALGVIGFELNQKANTNDVYKKINQAQKALSNNDLNALSKIRDLQAAEQRLTKTVRDPTKLQFSHPLYIHAVKPLRLDYYRKGRWHAITIKPRQHKVLHVVHAYLNHAGRIRYVVMYRGHHYTITSNGRYIRRAYLRHAKRVRVIENCVMYRSPYYRRHWIIKSIHRGATLKVRRIFHFKNGMTRLQLTNGYYVTSNRQYVKRIK